MHKCKLLEKSNREYNIIYLNLIIWKGKNYIEMTYNEDRKVSDIIEIYYCPFCGKKL